MNNKCPNCGSELKFQYVQNGDELLEECICSCGYYDNRVINLIDNPNLLIELDKLPLSTDTFPEDFRF